MTDVDVESRLETLDELAADVSLCLALCTEDAESPEEIEPALKMAIDNAKKLIGVAEEFLEEIQNCEQVEVPA